MNMEKTVKASIGTPVALCGQCAAEYAGAYTLRRVFVGAPSPSGGGIGKNSGGVDHKIICEGCRKRRFGAWYEIGGKINHEL